MFVLLDKKVVMKIYFGSHWLDLELPAL